MGSDFGPGSMLLGGALEKVRAQDRAKRAPRRTQDASKTPQDGPRRPRDGPRRPQDGPRATQDGPRRPQEAPRRPQEASLGTKNQPTVEQTSTKITAGVKQCRALRLGSRLGGVLEASWARLRGQHSSKLASQIEGKLIKDLCKNRSKNRCLPSSSFDAILMDFWKDNEGMLAPKSNQKSMSTSKGRSCKK